MSFCSRVHAKYLSKSSNCSFSSPSLLPSIQELAKVSATAIPYKRLVFACAESRCCTPCNNKWRFGETKLCQRKVRATLRAKFCSAGRSRCRGSAQALNQYVQTSDEHSLSINSSTKAKTTAGESWLPSGICQIWTASSCWIGRPRFNAGRSTARRLPLSSYETSPVDVVCKTAVLASNIAHAKLLPAETCSSESFRIICPTTVALPDKALLQRWAAKIALCPLKTTRANRSRLVGARSSQSGFSHSEATSAVTKRWEYELRIQSKKCATVPQVELKVPKARAILSGTLHNQPPQASATSSLKIPLINACMTASNAVSVNQICSMRVAMERDFLADWLERRADSVPPRTNAAVKGWSWLIFTTVSKKPASAFSLSGEISPLNDTIMACWAMDPASSALPVGSNSSQISGVCKSASMLAKCWHPWASARTWYNCSKLSYFERLQFHAAGCSTSAMGLSKKLRCVPALSSRCHTCLHDLFTISWSPSLEHSTTKDFFVRPAPPPDTRTKIMKWYELAPP